MVAVIANTAGADPAGEGEVLWAWADGRFTAAMHAARQREPQVALAEIDAILTRCPDHIMAVLLGIDLARRREDGHRLTYYRALLLALRPGNVANRVDLAEAMTRSAAHQAAQDLMEHLPPGAVDADALIALKLRAAGHSGEALRLDLMLDREAVAGTSGAAIQQVERIAAALADSGDGEIALRWLDRHERTMGAHPLIAYRRAQILYGLQHWDAAHQAFGRVEANGLDPGRQRAVAIFRARASRNADNLARAFDEFEAIFAAEPENAEACDFLVRQHWLEGRNEVAAAAIERFAEASPDDPAATWLKAETLKRQGALQEARDIYAAGLTAHAGVVSLRCRYADLLTDMGDLDAAQQVLDDAAAVEPASVMVFNRRIALARRRDMPPSQIITMCETILAHVPGQADALLQRANSILRMGRRVEAYHRFVEGARLNPSVAAFWRSAAQMAVSLNRKAEAKELADEARANFDETRPPHLCMLAAVYEAADDMQTAFEFASKATGIDPASSEAHTAMGRLLVAAGRYDEAWSHLRAADLGASRPIEITALLAQVAAGFRYLRPSQADLVEIEPLPGRFPDVLLERIGELEAPLQSEPCEATVMHVTSSLAAGGAERQVATTVAAMARDRPGRGVALVADDIDPMTSRDVFLPVVEAAGVTMHVLRQMREAAEWRELLVERPECAARVRLIAALPPDMQRVALPLYVLLARRRPRVVHLWQDMIAVSGGLAAILAGVPRIVLGTRSTRPVEQQRFRRYFESAYKAFLQRPGITMISNSRNGAADYEDWLGLAAGSVKVIYNAYDFARMRARTNAGARAAIRKQLGLPGDALVIGGVMRLSFEKRPELWTRAAIELASRDPRVHGLLVGQGPMQAELEAEIAAHNLSGRIRLVGQQSPIEPWMSAMELLFLSSLTEGLPNVLIEAQSLGVPVATMRVGGAPETVIEGETAVIADEGDIAVIASTLASLLLDAPRRAAFARAGRAWTRTTFSTEAMLRSLDALYGNAP